MRVYLLLALVCATLAFGQEPDGTVEHILTKIEGRLEDIQWVTDQIILVLDTTGKVWRSPDGGRSWHKQDQDGQLGSVSEIVRSPAMESHIIFVGRTSKSCWITKDFGATYQPISFNPERGSVAMHPSQPDWILASRRSEGCFTRKDCYKILYLTQDFGATWRPLVDYVVQFDWSPVIDSGAAISDNLIYATAQKTKTGSQRLDRWNPDVDFIMSNDFFQTTTVLVEHGNRFSFGDNSYLFVAAVDTVKTSYVNLQVSRSNSTHVHFYPAKIPNGLSPFSYNILDTAESTVFLHVNDMPFDGPSDWGKLYISDWSGTEYTLSATEVHRDDSGLVDFDSVEGIEGVFVMNRVKPRVVKVDTEEAEEKPKKGMGANKKDDGKAKATTTYNLHTYITFDKGGEWSRIPPPKVDSEGNPVECSKGNEKLCYLNLNGVTSGFGPFYSAASAPGFVLATGTVGPNLNTHHLNTYLSRDAGLTWKEIRKGSWIYEIGDHGGLLVMAKDHEATDSLIYSWDEGSSWKTIKITEQPFNVENVIIEPTSTDQRFVVYGDQDGEGVLVFVDFSDLHTRECVGHDAPDTKESDYELWSPVDPDDGDQCLMGHTISYVRRKAKAACFNPDDIELPTLMSHCKCTIADFECDYGYTRARSNVNVKTTVAVGKKGKDDDSESGSGSAENVDASAIDPNVCVLDDEEEIDWSLDPSKHWDCIDFTRKTKGYRRVPGDTCIGGEQWDADKLPCPKAKSSTMRTLALAALVMVAAIVCVVAAMRCQCLQNFMTCFQGITNQVKTAARARSAREEQVLIDEDPDYHPAEDASTSRHKPRPMISNTQSIVSALEATELQERPKAKKPESNLLDVNAI